MAARNSRVVEVLTGDADHAGKATKRVIKQQDAAIVEGKHCPQLVRLSHAATDQMVMN